MTALLAGLAARFNAPPFKLIACAAAGLLVLLVLFAAYREGKHAGDEAAAVALAKHNAGIAARYMQDAQAAQDAMARERARADELSHQIANLKEQVRDVAKGDASPGVDAAVHGLRPPAARRDAAVPGSPR